MPTILVADDDKNMLLLYEQELSDDGHKVELAAGGREALERFRASRPDLVILDLKMPDMDGIELLGRLMAEDKTVPVIINTGYSSFKENFMTWVADDYVIKSGDLTELKGKIAKALARGAARSLPTP